ncbi:hypothetical protein, partial [Stutzerimonas nitrititolerans]
NHRFEIGKGWSQPEIPDYFRPSLKASGVRSGAAAPDLNAARYLFFSTVYLAFLRHRAWCPKG